MPGIVALIQIDSLVLNRLGTYNELKPMFLTKYTIATEAATPYMPHPRMRVKNIDRIICRSPIKSVTNAGIRTLLKATWTAKTGMIVRLKMRCPTSIHINGASPAKFGPTHTAKSEGAKPHIKPIGSAMIKPKNLIDFFSNILCHS